MKLQLVTVAFDPMMATFPDSPLETIPGDIVNVVEHFFTYDGRFLTQRFSGE